MKVEPIAIAKLKPAPYNPRTLSDDRRKDLQRSLDEFGLVEPLVWNKQTGHVVGGNQRLVLLKESGLKKIDCAVVDLPLDREKLLNLRLNKTSGEWDAPMLSEMLKELDPADWGLTGFDDIEIEPMVAVGDGIEHKTLCEQFGVPPFSVLDPRQGYWQDRKRAWLALGIQSELGRGAGAIIGGQPLPLDREREASFKNQDKPVAFRTRRRAGR